MNKKQLIVAWVVGILICLVLLPLHPKRRWTVVGTSFVEIAKELKGIKKEQEVRRYMMQKSLIILIIGGLLIYTLKDKKK